MAAMLNNWEHKIADTNGDGSIDVEEWAYYKGYAGWRRHTGCKATYAAYAAFKHEGHKLME